MVLSKENRDSLFRSGLELLEDWAFDKDWVVEFDYLGRDEMDPGTKIISVSTRQNLEKQLYTLLHECGHVLVQANKEVYVKKYPITAKMNCYAEVNRRLEKTKKYKVDVISEEIDAWQRGKKLAERLGIYIDEEVYNKIRSDCIYSYIEWATGAGNYGG